MDAHPSLKMKPDRRAALFAAATTEFTDRGFEQASLNQIIGAVGMSKSSFYHYFASKTDLFKQIILQTLGPFSDIAMQFDPETLTAETFWPVISQTIESGTAQFMDQPEIFSIGRMFHRNLGEPNSICADMMEAPKALITRAFEHGKTLGVVRDDLPSSLLLEGVMGLGMAVDRWATAHTEHYTPAEFSAFTQKIMDMFLRILAPEG